MDKNLKKLVYKVFEISYNHLSIEFCEKVDTFAYDQSTNKWLPDGFTLFIKVKNKTDERWNSSEVERCIYEHLGIETVISH